MKQSNRHWNFKVSGEICKDRDAFNKSHWMKEMNIRLGKHNPCAKPCMNAAEMASFLLESDFRTRSAFCFMIFWVATGILFLVQLNWFMNEGHVYVVQRNNNQSPMCTEHYD